MATKKNVMEKVTMLNDYGMNLKLKVDFKKYDKYTLIFDNFTGTHTFNIMHFQTTKEIKTFLDGIIFIVVQRYVNVKSQKTIGKEDKLEYDRIHKNDYKILGGGIND